jgi:protein-S-isoprenylcysteine O-methyltransferase Ste14
LIMWQPLVLENAGLRALLLLVPVAAWIGLFLRGGFTARQSAGALLAFVWQVQAILLVFGAGADGKMAIADVELSVGLAVLLGAVTTYAFLGRNIALAMLASAAILIVFTGLPTSNPGHYASALTLAIVPGLLLGRWTAEGSNVYLRSVLQALCWACLLLWLFPSLVFSQTGMTWDVLLSRPHWQNVALALPLIVPGFLLMSALYQFAAEGEGTGFPYDPPQRLVTNGVYAYVSNPMQLGICLMMFWWGIMLGSFWVSLSAAVAVFLFVVFKDVCNGSCAIGKTDENWIVYQQNVPSWLPRLQRWNGLVRA